MDIKKQISDAVEKITKDEALKAEFKKDPVKAVEKATGIDLPDDVTEKIVDAVKAKLTADTLAGAADKIKKLF